MNKKIVFREKGYWQKVQFGYNIMRITLQVQIWQKLVKVAVSSGIILPKNKSNCVSTFIIILFISLFSERNCLALWGDVIVFWKKVAIWPKAAKIRWGKSLF